MPMLILWQALGMETRRQDHVERVAGWQVRIGIKKRWAFIGFHLVDLTSSSRGSVRPSVSLGVVAQLVERLICNENVAGSIPACTSNFDHMA